MRSVSAEPLVLPPEADIPAAADFRKVAELFNLQELEAWGNEDFCETPRAQLARLQSTPTRRRQLLVARAGTSGKIVGVARVNFPLTDNLHVATLNIVVDPAARRKGIGSQLYTAAEALAAGRRLLIAETDHPDSGGTAAAGARPASYIPHDAAASFAAACGFSLELVERISRLRLPVGGLGGIPQEREAAPEGYELLFWEGACPAGLVDAYARLRQRMSTDAPQGGLDLVPEAWDEARVRETEATASEMGYRVLVCAVRHTASGELAGHTVLEVPKSNPAVGYQEDTLVLESHRGNRLGMALKAANLQRLQSDFPGVERVYTWNAEENRYMLAINEQLGFQGIGYSGEWQKELAGS